MKKSAAKVLCCLLALLTAVSALAGCGEVGEDLPPLPLEDDLLPQSPFFYTVRGGKNGADVKETALAFNAVCKVFGGVNGEPCKVYRFGNEPTYYEWMAMKIAWTGDAAYLRELKDKIVGCPQTDNGYLWSWGTSTYWPTGAGDMHYDGLFRFVAAVAEILRYEGSASFLDEKDATTYGSDTAKDASAGRTVYEKCAAAMDYADKLLFGGTGIITLTEQSVYLKDGVTRFDANANGEFVWNNTGRAASSGSNYWDNLCFGHKDAYETMLYYHALLAMRDIETMRGDAEAAKRLEARADTVGKAFNETFWSEETGRYIACIDADGKKWDPGLTFLNTEALSYGLGDAAKAESILSWIDGDRLIEGDTLGGFEILDYSGVLMRAMKRKKRDEPRNFAPISNTVSIEDLSEGGPAWWNSLEGAINVGENGNAAYGRHLENGGYIFYTVYYELAARAKYRGAADVVARAENIADVYRFNGLDSDKGNWVEGLVDEYPESGIVSRVFIDSLCGITPTADALTVRPNLPENAATLGIENFYYGGAVMRIEVGRKTLSLKSETALSGKIVFYPEKSGDYNITLTFADGTTVAEKIKTDRDGAVTAALAGRGAVSVDISPSR